MRRISPHARTLRRDMTDAERRFWYAVRDRRLDGVKFKRQVTLGPYIVDFYCAGLRLIVELDGGQHDEDTDLDRSNWLTEQGYKIVRFWNNDVLTNLEGVLQSFQTQLPSPSPVLDGRGSG